MKRNLYIFGSLAFASLMPLSLQAQTTAKKDTTMNRTVVVEQEYNPDILDASKVNVLPKVEAPTVNKKPVEYATTLFPATVIPADLMRSYTSIETQPGSKPGYARIGYGNYGNLDVLANYLFRMSDVDKLNVRFQMDGMDGKLTLPESSDKWNAHYYRTRANVDYTHQFATMDLNFGGNFGLSNFNYRPMSINGKQKFTSGDIHAGLNFTDEKAPLQFNIETGLSLYGRQHNLIHESLATSLNETIWRINGNVSGAINDEQRVYLALTMNNFWYGGHTANAETGDKYIKNYTALNLNPYYELNGDDWKLHAGAHVDLSFGFDKSLRVSPDISAQYNFSDSYILYAKATGGKLFNDFRRMEEICPYSELPMPKIYTEDTKPEFATGYVSRPYDTYELINGTLGFKASPYPGVWFNLYGGYQNLKNDLTYLGVPIAFGEMNCLTFAQGNTNNAYLGGEMSYDYKDLITLSAKYLYRGWNTKAEDEMLLITKPESEMNFNIHIHPFSALNVNVGYDLISRKKVTGIDKMPAISNLYIGGSYNLFKGISVYARLNNLLNKKYQYYLGYPAEGFSFLGGLSFQF